MYSLHRAFCQGGGVADGRRANATVAACVQNVSICLFSQLRVSSGASDSGWREAGIVLPGPLFSEGMNSK